MTIQELKWAQKDLYNGAKKISEAGMRLHGTKYESDYTKVWDAITKLNTRLINDIKK